MATEAEPEWFARRRMSDAVFALALPRPGAAAAVIAVDAGSNSEALASTVFAISRDICSWPALSSVMLAFNCSICCLIVATSPAIDWINGVWSETEDGIAAASGAGEVACEDTSVTTAA